MKNFSWIVNYLKDAKILTKGQGGSSWNFHPTGIPVFHFGQGRALNFTFLALALLYLIEMAKLNTLISLKYGIYVILPLPCDEVDKFLYNYLILFSHHFPKGALPVGNF